MKHLDATARPVVAFDPANVEHRKLYQQFLKTNSWNHSPVRFDMPEKYIELPYYINLVLAQYYMGLDKKLQPKG